MARAKIIGLAVLSLLKDHGIHGAENEQLYSSASDREKTNKKTIYNKHQNTIDVQDNQAVTCV